MLVLPATTIQQFPWSQPLVSQERPFAEPEPDATQGRNLAGENGKKGGALEFQKSEENLAQPPNVELKLKRDL